LDAAGALLEDLLGERLRRAGVPLLGPNCMGLFNADPAVRLDLTFSPAPPRPGHVAFLSQSGALGALVLTVAAKTGLAFSLFASLGNEAGVTHLDALEYAAADPLTRVIVLYIETLGDPHEFVRVARQVSRRKPVILLKGGRTETGARAASSHTGALATGTRALDAVLRQSGVVPVETTGEMLNLAMAFSRTAVPRGRRVRVLTNAGGPGVLATDVLARAGLELPPLSAERQAALRAFVTARAPLNNPVDLTVEGTPEMYGQAARALLDDRATDALLGIFVEPPRVRGPEVLEELRQAVADSDKCVVLAFPGQDELVARVPEGNFALIDYPEAAAAVLGALARYASSKEKPVGRPRRFRVARRRVATLIKRAQREGRTALDLEESLAALRAYGIPLARSRFVRKPSELSDAARRLGFPLALKVVSGEIVHKTEVGGVVLNIANQKELSAAYRGLRARLNAAGLGEALRGVLLQEMATGDRELILGFHRPEPATPLLLAGLGGIQVEAMNAVALRLLPVTDEDVRALLEEMPGAGVLGAFRGMRPVARGRLEESLLRLAQLADEFPAIASIDVNPFLASHPPGGCKAVDARILLTR
jgi:acyl-CoA synthetase (NDP forming)